MSVGLAGQADWDCLRKENGTGMGHGWGRARTGSDCRMGLLYLGPRKNFYSTVEVNWAKDS